MVDSAEAPGVGFVFLNEIGIISQLSRAFMEARLPDGLIMPHFAVCNHLIRVKDGQTPMVLARAFQVPKTSMTHTLAGLESRGLIEMRRNPQDGRSKCVFITAAGRKFREDAIESITPLIAQLEEDVPLSQMSDVLPTLTQVRQKLDRMRD